jgi:EF hand
MIAVRPVLLACLLFALTPVASAQQQALRAAPTIAPAKPTASGTAPQGTGDYLSRMDDDGDRKVSLLEYQDWLTYAFDGMDRNRDGVLTPDEQPGGRGKTLARDAHRARVAERFGRQDIDRSGFLDARELAAPPQGK